jgi:hypothetical protein
MADSVTTVSVTIGTAAVLADVSGLLHSYPLVSFAGMGCIGGIAGWALAMDRGELDKSNARQILCFLCRRLMLGACIGVAASVWWSDTAVNQGLWMLITGLLSIDPVRGTRVAWDRILAMIPKATK